MPRAETTTPRLAEIVTDLAKDSFCSQVAGLVETYGSCYLYNRHGILVSTAPRHGAVQTVVPHIPLPGLLYLSFYPKLAGHPRERPTYDTVTRDLYRPHMPSDIYTTVRGRRECATNRAGPESKRHLTMFHANGPLEFVTMDGLGPLPKTKTGTSSFS